MSKTNAAGCGSVAKDYGYLLRTDEGPWRSLASLKKKEFPTPFTNCMSN